MKIYPYVFFLQNGLSQTKLRKPKKLSNLHQKTVWILQNSIEKYPQRTKVSTVSNSEAAALSWRGDQLKAAKKKQQTFSIMVLNSEDPSSSMLCVSDNGGTIDGFDGEGINDADIDSAGTQ